MLQKTLDYYKQHQISVVTYYLKSDRDIDRIDLVILDPDSINLCINPKCLKCGEHLWKKYLLIIDGQCWNCRAPMKIATSHSELRGLSDFSNSDIQLANENGCYLKSQYSNTMKKNYVANTCRKCLKFTGNHYLFRDYVANHEYSRDKLEAGYYCFHCRIDE